MISFPIALIKFITEYVPTPYELVEHEMKTKGLPVICITNTGKFHIIRVCVMYRSAYYNGDNLYSVFVRDRTLAHRRKHVKMRADLMAFHLSKV